MTCCKNQFGAAAPAATLGASATAAASAAVWTILCRLGTVLGNRWGRQRLEGRLKGPLSLSSQQGLYRAPALHGRFLVFLRQRLPLCVGLQKFGLGIEADAMHGFNRPEAVRCELLIDSACSFHPFPLSYPQDVPLALALRSNYCLVRDSERLLLYVAHPKICLVWVSNCSNTIIVSVEDGQKTYNEQQDLHNDLRLSHRKRA